MWARLIALLMLALAHPASMAIKEPGYEVVRRLDGADGEGFRLLAGYILAKNKGERRVEMTAPVTRAAEPAKLEMTAPVTRSADAGGLVVQFVLPRGATLATAPEPLDTRAQLREVPPALVAAVCYSRTWSQANYAEHLEKLRSALRAAKIASTGEPTLSRYNSPMTPWFMRRNEIWLAVDGPER
jgi:hypothetical protein